MKKRYLKYGIIIVCMGVMACSSTTESVKKEKSVNVVKEIKKDKGPFTEKIYVLVEKDKWEKMSKFRYKGDGIYEAKTRLEAGSYKIKVGDFKSKYSYGIKNLESGVLELGKEYIEVKDDNTSGSTLYLSNSEKLIFRLNVSEMDNILFTIERGGKRLIKREVPESVKESLEWRGNKAGIDFVENENGTRKYSHYTTLKLRDENPEDGNIEYSELVGQTTVRTGSPMFDGLFALAMEESRQNSVEYITDWSFNGGRPLKYSAFETGEKWHYVWTRDTAYSVDLALSYVDPKRSMNSLLYKVSKKREEVGEGINGGMEIVQDTGSGGSWPISSDRVTWSLGAWETIKYLSGEEKKSFSDITYEAIKNTVENDRIAIYDAKDGLYRGEESFLDWREQTYPRWTENETVHIGMSKALSTNANHYASLKIVSKLAKEKGNLELAIKYEEWAKELKESINREFWIEEKGMYGSIKSGEPENRTVHMFDLLGESLVVELGIASEERAKRVVANYPHSEAGPSVIWPQLPEIPIYHNRGMWPFVTAYSLKSAKKVKNGKIFNHNVDAMFRSSALNLSNMENYDFISGNHSFVDKYNEAGPVINSKRQLWSVAGYISMVVNSIFGVESDNETIIFEPFFTDYIIESKFGNQESVELKNFKYLGKNIDVKINLPEKLVKNSNYVVDKVTFNGSKLENNWVKNSELLSENNFVIDLKKEEDSSSIKLVKLDDYREMSSNEMIEIFTPKEVEIESLNRVESGVEITISGEESRDIVYNIFKNGKLIGEKIESRIFIDEEAKKSNKLTDTIFSVENGLLKSDVYEVTDKYGKKYFSKWGGKNDIIKVDNIKVKESGNYYFNIVYGNSYNSVNTGITACVKMVEVRDSESGEVVGRKVLFMPHMSGWREWGKSNPLEVELKKEREYNVTIKEFYNMTYFEHFAIYNNEGGTNGPINRANIAELILSSKRDYYSVNAEYRSSGNQSHNSKVYGD